jgi:hypothetical protein
MGADVLDGSVGGFGDGVIRGSPMNPRPNGSLTFDDSIQGATTMKLTATKMLTVDGGYLDPEGIKLRGTNTIGTPGATYFRFDVVRA